MGDVCVLCHSALAFCSFVVLFPDTSITMAAFGCLYTLLECSPCAAKKEIEKAFRKISVKHHPDKGGDNVLFQQLSRAREILMNEELREVYDEGGMEAVLRVEQHKMVIEHHRMVIQEGKKGKRRYCNAVKKCKDLHEARSNYKYIT